MKKGLAVAGAIFCLVGSAFAVQSMQVTVCPRLTPNALGETAFVEQVEDLFINQTDEWSSVLEDISHFKFYSTPVVWLNKREPELLRQSVANLAAMGKEFAVEVGIRKGHETTETSILDPITAAGGTVDFIITDNVFIKSQYRADTIPVYNWTYEDAVTNYAEYVAGIKQQYPNLKVGILEAAFRFHWDDAATYPAEDPALDYGDLKDILLDVIAACEALGTKIDIFQPEYSYERIVNTENGWAKLQAMEAFCKEQGLEFYFLFNDHTGGNTSDQLFHENVMNCLKSVKSHGLTPALGTIQSWYEHPVAILPEDEPYTFMYLAREFIAENQKAWTPAGTAIAAWWDASDTNAATVIDGKLDSLADKSGNGFTLTAPSAGQRPLLSTWQGLNAIQIVNEGEAGDWLATAENVIGTSDNFTIFSVMESSSLSRGGVGDGGGWSVRIKEHRCNLVLTSGGAVQFNSVGVAGKLQVVRMDQHDARELSFASNGGAFTNEPLTKTDLRSSSRYFELGTSGSGAEAGNIGEVLIFTQLISEAERQRVEGYLAHKWNLVDDLDPDHPYKYYPPGVPVPLDRTVNHAVPFAWLDGINVDWSNNYEAAVLDDTDGDGVTTWQEYWSGTDPLDSHSFFRIDSLAYDGTNVTLQWHHSAITDPIPDITIRATTNLITGPWFDAGTASPSNGLNTWSQSASQQRFYRLVVGEEQ